MYINIQLYGYGLEFIKWGNGRKSVAHCKLIQIVAKEGVGIGIRSKLSVA